MRNGGSADGLPPCDRLLKYALGAVRLGALLGVAAAVLPCHDVCWPRVVTFLAFGVLGAVVNERVVTFHRRGWLLLAAAVGAAVADLQRDLTVVVYLTKTTAGDVLAGKLDTFEWRLGGAIVAAAVAVVLAVAPWRAVAVYGRVAVALFVVQLVSEYGDNHYERLTFFRHRYAFEVGTVVALVALYPLSAPEAAVVLLDLTACWAYRAANAVVQLVARMPVSATRLWLFKAMGCCRGYRVQHVTDARVVTAVLKSSIVKGDALERHIACPAWHPVLSLESVDGDVWRAMHKDFVAVAKALPPVQRLVDVAARHLGALAASASPATPVTSRDVTAVTVRVFSEFLFAKPWQPAFDPLVDGVEAWRQALACRGAGDAAAKSAAIDVVVQLLLPHSPLWPVFGDKWALPRYYSLLLQPFLISPAINTSDFAVAVARSGACDGDGPSTTTAALLRQAHPFPILERWVDAAVHVDGVEVVPPATQVVIFSDAITTTTDAWPVFGAGTRACAGAHLARPWLDAVRAMLVSLPSDAVATEAGHRHSGRNNDGTASVWETLYMLRQVLCAMVCDSRRSGGRLHL